MKQIRPILLRNWFLLLCFGCMIVCWNIVSWIFAPVSGITHLYVTFLWVLYVVIYPLGFSVARPRYIRWLSWLIQVLLVVAILNLSSQGLVPFLLCPVLFLAAQAQERTITLLHKLDIAHAQLSTYALRVEELTMVTERQRIARDLHDTLVQGVASLIMQMNVVQTHLQHQRIERAQEILAQVIESARDTLTDARCALGELRTGGIRPDDLVEVVQEEINRFCATTAIPCTADLALLAKTPVPFCEQVSRVITEGLTNVARHAHAHTVWIRVTQPGDMLTVEIRDDGIGFDPAITETQVGHYGLLGIRERAKLIGGYVEVQSAKSRGTTLRVSLPIHPVQQREGVRVCRNPFELSSPTTI